MGESDTAVPDREPTEKANLPAEPAEEADDAPLDDTVGLAW